MPTDSPNQKADLKPPPVEFKLNTNLLSTDFDDDLLMLDGFNSNEEEQKSQSSSLLPAQSENIEKQINLLDPGSH
jgi:hypothetical protein